MATRKKKLTAKKKTIKRPIKKKITGRRVAAKPKKVVKKARPAKKIKENIIGIVTHYFPKISAAVVKLKVPLKIGDSIKIKGHTTDFTQDVTSIQINHVPINLAKKGQEIGLLVVSRVRKNDVVSKA